LNPLIEIDIVFDSYAIEIHHIFCDKKWETKFILRFFDIFWASLGESMDISSSYTENTKNYGYNKSSRPELSGFCNDKKIDIRIFISFPHGSGITECYESDTREEYQQSESDFVSQRKNIIWILHVVFLNFLGWLPGGHSEQ
jgi:hypothetical protein